VSADVIFFVLCFYVLYLTWALRHKLNN